MAALTTRSRRPEQKRNLTTFDDEGLASRAGWRKRRHLVSFRFDARAKSDRSAGTMSVTD